MCVYRIETLFTGLPKGNPAVYYCSIEYSIDIQFKIDTFFNYRDETYIQIYGSFTPPPSQIPPYQYG